MGKGRQERGWRVNWYQGEGGLLFLWIAERLVLMLGNDGTI